MKHIIRVFPRRTRLTPTDDLAFVGDPPLWVEADEVHISVTFTYDLPEAERLYEKWRHVAPTLIGGPATGEKGGDFSPGLYLKPGYVITSRGCPNRCWFCEVWKREGNTVRELPITWGWNVLDDNLLACSESHFEKVCLMLMQAKRNHRIVFSGGLEAARLTPFHVNWLRKVRPIRMYFAYDTPEDFLPLKQAGKLLLSAGWTRRSHTLCAYVLIGYPGDNLHYAERRLQQTWKVGFTPYAMLYRPPNSTPNLSPEWKQLQRTYLRPQILHTILKK